MLYRNLKQKLRSLAVGVGLIGVAMAAVVVPTSVNGLNCSILPQRFCDEAQNDDGSGSNNPERENAIWSVLVWVLNIMAGGVVILTVGGLVYGAILYTSAGGSPEQVKKAVGVFTNVAIGFVAFVLMWSILQWLIPGGVIL